MAIDDRRSHESSSSTRNSDRSLPAMYGKHPIFDRSQRPLNVVVIGAGPSGIAMLIELKKVPYITVQCFEKNHEVGGTWLENRYPGAACDVASHAYQYTFHPKKDWSRHFAPAEEIGEYFISVAKANDLYHYIKFNSSIAAASWNEDIGRWAVKAVNGQTGTTEEITADVLINAGGILNAWKWPEIEGLHNFRGRKVHTAAWDASLDLTDASVAVIGSGASSIQVVPNVQPVARHVDVYVRSPTYILPTVGFGIESSSYNEPYTEAEIETFSADPVYYQKFRKRIEQQMNENFSASIKISHEQLKARLWAEDRMRSVITSAELQKKLIPNWELGCRRITPGLPYLKAVQKPNLDIIRENIKRVTETGIETDDGCIHETDVIICATGFDVSFSSRFPITGRSGLTLQDMWKDDVPGAYLGTAIAGLPNYFTILGPNCPIANGSLIPCIEWSVKYIVQILEKIQTDQIKTIEVKKSVQDYFNHYAQSVHKDLVWTGSCQSWYKDRSTGKVVAVWPGSSIHFMEMIATPRWEDYEIEYIHDNPFFFMGNGVSQRETRGEDLTFYLDAASP